MARSAEAIRRRALKRNRSVQEQRKADSKDAAAAEEREQKRRASATIASPKTAIPVEKKHKKITNDNDDGPTKESKIILKNEKALYTAKREQPTADKSKGEGNEKDRTTTNINPELKERTRFQPSRKSIRHDPATSKKLKWAKQASSDTIEKNLDLRKRYKETGGEGMEEEDVSRAKLLLKRDERKRQKKELKRKKKWRARQ